MYEVAQSAFTIRLSANKPLVKYQTDAAQMQTAINNNRPSYQPINQIVFLSEIGVFGRDWKALLQSEKKVHFEIPRDSSDCKKYGRVFVVRARYATTTNIRRPAAYLALQGLPRRHPTQTHHRRPKHGQTPQIRRPKDQTQAPSSPIRSQQAARYPLLHRPTIHREMFRSASKHRRCRNG